MNSRFRGSTLITLLLLAAVIFLVYSMINQSQAPEKVALSSIAAQIQEGAVEEIIVTGNQLLVVRHDGQQFRAHG